MKPEFTYNDKILEIKFPDKIDFMISNFLSEVLLETNSIEIGKMILDLSKTTFITSPGVMNILCFAAYYKKVKNFYIDTRILLKSEEVFEYLLNLGFFSQMNVYANLLIPKEILENEKELKMKNMEEISLSSSSIIMPIANILDNSAGRRLFEEYTRSIAINFKFFFSKICKIPDFGFPDDMNESQNLFEAFYESIKNVYDHSERIGFGMIHSSIDENRTGTTISIFDIGVGIVNTVLNSGKYAKTNSRVNAILWALEKGNSRGGTNGNQGIGLSTIKDYVKEKNGILSIKTDKYLINFRKGKIQPAQNVNFFPGTQIVIYIPLNINK